MRRFLPIAGALIVLSSGSAAGQTVYRPQLVAVRNCPRADSLFGPIADGLHPGLGATQISEGLMYLDSGMGSPGGSAEAHSVSFTVLALAEPHPTAPTGILHLMLSGDWARTILKSQVSPPLRILLPDSIVISPTHVELGRFDGPDQLAIAPLTAMLTSATVSAIARATSVTILVDTMPLSVPWEVLNSLHDVYRTSLCGYGNAW